MGSGGGIQRLNVARAAQRPNDRRCGKYVEKGRRVYEMEGKVVGKAEQLKSGACWAWVRRKAVTYSPAHVLTVF